MSNGLIGLNFQIGLKNIVLNIITGKFPAQKKVLTREHWIELANAFGLANQTFSNEDHFKAALVQAIRRALGLPPATSWNDSDLLQPLVNTALNSSASPNPVIPSPVPVIPQSQIPPPSFVPYSPSISPQSYSPSFSPSPNQTPNLPNQYLPPSYSPSNTSPSASPNTSPSPTPYQDNMTMSDSPAYSDQSFDYSSDSSPGSSVADQTLAERIKWWKRLEKTPSKIRHNLKLWNSSRDKRPFINMYLLYGGLSEAAGKKLTIKELIEEIVRLIKEWRQERKKYFREKKYGKDSPKGKKNKKNKKKDKKKDKKKKKSDSKKDKKKSKKDKKKDKKKKKSVSFDDSTIPAEFLVKKNRQKPSWTSGSINSLKLHASRNPTYTRNRVRLRPDLVGFASNEGKAHWSDPATFVPDYVRSQIKCAKSRGKLFI